MAVNFHDGPIDHCHFHVGLLRQGIENTFKDTCYTPISEAAIDQVPFAELCREIALLRPGSGDPEHGLQKEPGITARPTWIGLLAQTVRFDLRPLAIRNDVAINRHPNLHFRKLESEIRQLGKPDTQQTLVQTQQTVKGN